MDFSSRNTDRQCSNSTICLSLCCNISSTTVSSLVLDCILKINVQITSCNDQSVLMTEQFVSLREVTLWGYKCAVQILISLQPDFNNLTVSKLTDCPMSAYILKLFYSHLHCHPYIIEISYFTEMSKPMQSKLLCVFKLVYIKGKI